MFVFKLEPMNSSERESVLAVSKNLSMDAKPNGGVMGARRQYIYVIASILAKYLTWILVVRAQRGLATRNLMRV